MTAQGPRSVASLFEEIARHVPAVAAHARLVLWYSGRSFAVLGFFAALLVAAAYNSLGGKPLFGKALLAD